MVALLERLNPEQLVGVIAIVVGGIVAIVLILCVTKYQIQALTDLAAMERDRQQVDLTIRTRLIEHGIATGASLETLVATEPAVVSASAKSKTSDRNKVDASLAKHFGMLEIEPEVIEETLVQALQLDPSRKSAIIDTIEELIAEGADHAPIMAVVRGLCHSPREKEGEASVPVAMS